MKQKGIIKLSWILLVLAVIGLMFIPVVSNIIRLSIIFGMILIWAFGIILFWKIKWVWSAFIFVLVAALLVALLPGRPADPEELRASFVAELLDYEGTKYVWGGENRMGIDCSGLIREAYVKANLKTGLRTLNPKLIRNAAEVWCIDCGANILGNGYNGRTKLIESADNLRKLSIASMEAGDIIVAKTGFHTFAYIGDGLFIEASPEKGKVVKVSVAEKSKEWENVPIKWVQWRDMQLN